MTFHYGHLAQRVIETLIRENEIQRIVSLDLETKVLRPEDFLTGEPILATSLAYLEDEEIQTRVLVVNEEGPKSEEGLMSELDSFLIEMRPLVIVGYNNTGYDLPLLTLKVRHSSVPFWALKDTLSRSFPLDMMHVVRFEIASYDRTAPHILSLEKVLRHPRFAQLPLLNGKRLINVAGMDKGQAIYNLWKTDRKTFQKYSEADAKDVFTIFKHLFIDKALLTVGA